MITKKVICPERIRMIPKQFSWIDHALVRSKHICGLSHESQGLYLFLVTVSDVEGLSYYSDPSIERYLRLSHRALSLARHELCEKGLIAYSSPFYQVLSLQNSSTILPKAPCEKNERNRGTTEVVSVGEILNGYLGGIQ